MLKSAKVPNAHDTASCTKTRTTRSYKWFGHEPHFPTIGCPTSPLANTPLARLRRMLQCAGNERRSKRHASASG
eukprot:6395010-Pyramimonas_sp.AAC.1